MVLNVNPMLITSGQGLFPVSSGGIVQGTAEPDPGTVWQLRAGVLAASEALPMWGGLPVTLEVPGAAGGPVTALGTIVKRAVSGGPIDAFSVFDSAYGMISSPASVVPQAGIGMQVNTYRMNGGARIGVAATPALVAAVQGGSISPAVAWDYANGMLDVAEAPMAISSGTYSNGNGTVVLTVTGNTLQVGEIANVSGLTGTGAYAQLNGEWEITAASPTQITYVAPNGLGPTTITGGSVGGSVAITGIKVLRAQQGNCQVVEYDPQTGQLNWNFNGSGAVIQLAA